MNHAPSSTQAGPNDLQGMSTEQLEAAAVQQHPQGQMMQGGEGGVHLRTFSGIPLPSMEAQERTSMQSFGHTYEPLVRWVEAWVH